MGTMMGGIYHTTYSHYHEAASQTNSTYSVSNGQKVIPSNVLSKSDRIVTYVDGLLQTVLYFSFPAGTTMWQRGNFPAKDTSVNPPVPLVDPWSQTGRPNTPFDQNFYLILSLAIGGQNAYFIDGVDGKPWVDKSPSAMWDFWQGRSTWNATWGNGTDRALAVSSINMWTLC